MLAVVVALGLAAWALVTLLDHPDADADPELVIGPDGEVLDEREFEELQRERLRAIARGSAALERKSGLFAADEDRSDDDDEDDDGESLVGLRDSIPAAAPTLEEARAGFDFVMSKLEKVGRGRRRLSVEEWQESYRAANDAFAALSMHLDATDGAQLDELEEAHRRLQRALRRVRVRGGKKFEPL